MLAHLAELISTRARACEADDSPSSQLINDCMSHDKLECESSIHSRIDALVGMQDAMKLEVGRKWGTSGQGVSAGFTAGMDMAY
jgi:hypothetical protein